ncbi:MAG: pyruvate, phosphate dikinase [Candidatus Dormibacter sp.]
MALSTQAPVKPKAATSKKWVYLFEEGNKDLRDLLGGKGAGVAEMTRAGLPVPPGFTITTEACNAYYDSGKRFPAGMWEQAMEALHTVEAKTGKRLGDVKNPLLVSVRSGAKFSMPGMMDTVLNLGLNPQTLEGLAKLTGDRRFALDAYRRFAQMFGKIVLGIDAEKFEHKLTQAKEKAKVKTDPELKPEQLEKLLAEFKAIILKESGKPFPDDPQEQLKSAIEAVFSSWNNKRAQDYRNFNKIPHTLGTAVNVQMMVFGNMGNDSGTGVAFTRDPNTGEKVLYGDYLINAQGEDVVAGIRTPKPIASLKKQLPEVYRQFEETANQLEKHYRDVQDLEFTIEKKKLWMLQTRSAKRTAAAAVKIAVDMVSEKMIFEDEAVQRVEPIQVDQLLHPRIDPKAKPKIIAKGLDASPGAASGKAVFDADRAEARGKKGEAVILVRIETNPDDVHGMIAAKGVLTARGGKTSHAAVVARGMGKPCVAGAESLKVDLAKKLFSVNGTTVKEGDLITINGSTGDVILGSVPMIEPAINKDLNQLLTWADTRRRLEVWTNADYPRDAKVARAYGAQGIGLCRTEHMFMEQERLPMVQKMILAEDTKERQKWLAKLLPFQRSDFSGIFKEMHGLPVIIRLIDPPLHEFLPNYDEQLVKVTIMRLKKASKKKLEPEEALLRAIEGMREQNPMLGLRGIRLGLMFPEIIQMQVRAILEAAIALKKKNVDVRPEIMIPLVGHVNELHRTRDLLEAVVKQVFSEQKAEIPYKFGTMMEIPRACLTAGEIAEYAEFFSFGTNDLTQTTFGYSRDDAEGKFLLRYVEEKILPVNPFESLDQVGVGRLMKMAVEEGRKAHKDLEIGICGEHGGDPASIHFCHSIGLNYVSCSPYRVPVARLAAAQAAMASSERDR